MNAFLDYQNIDSGQIGCFVSGWSMKIFLFLFLCKIGSDMMSGCVLDRKQASP